MMITAFSNYFSQFAKLSAKQNLLRGQTDSLLLSVVTLLARPGGVGEFCSDWVLDIYDSQPIPHYTTSKTCFPRCYHSPHIGNIHPLLPEQDRLLVASPRAALCCFLLNWSSKGAAPVRPSPD